MNTTAATTTTTTMHATSTGISKSAVNLASASNGSTGSSVNPRTVIERGASWSHEETRILLSLWGQDLVQRQLTNSKRTRHVWQRIAERIRQNGFERTPGMLFVLFFSV